MARSGASSAAHAILSTGPDQIADRHLRFTVKDETVDITVPGALSLDPQMRAEGWKAPKREHEFKGPIAEQLLKMKPSLEAMNLRVVSSGA